jgi:hypothetical protein
MVKGEWGDLQSPTRRSRRDRADAIGSWPRAELAAGGERGRPTAGGRMVTDLPMIGCRLR